jgi:hypothetical protein
VLHDVRVRWDVEALEPHGPDIAVMRGVKKRKDWGTFDVKEERAYPLLVIEVTSPKTRLLDLNDKVSEYQQARVPYYVIVDRAKGKKRLKRRLLGYHLTPFGYCPMKTNELGWLWLEPVKIWLGFRGRQLVCVDESYKLIPKEWRLNKFPICANPKCLERLQKFPKLLKSGLSPHPKCLERLQKFPKLLKSDLSPKMPRKTSKVSKTFEVWPLALHGKWETYLIPVPNHKGTVAKLKKAEVQAEVAKAKAQAAETQAQVERTQRLAAETQAKAKVEAAETKAEAAETKVEAAETQAQVERTQRLAAETQAKAKVEAAETKAKAAETKAEAAEAKAEAAEAKVEAAETQAQVERTQRLAMEEELECLRAKFASLSHQTDA